MRYVRNTEETREPEITSSEVDERPDWRKEGKTDTRGCNANPHMTGLDSLDFFSSMHVLVTWMVLGIENVTAVLHSAT